MLLTCSVLYPSGPVEWFTKATKKPNERSYMDAIDVPAYKIVRLQAVIARITYALHRMSAFLTLPHHDGLSYESNKTNMTLEKESLED